MSFIFLVLLIFIILIINEFFLKKFIKNKEFNRKFIHIFIGTILAFLPYVMSWQLIRVLSVSFVIVILISKKFNIFKSIHGVSRNTYGEVFFGLVIGILTFITHDKIIFTISVLNMSLSDGLAAVVGSKYGKRHKYKVFGVTKSILGTLTFMLTSYALLIIFLISTHTNPNIYYLLVPILAGLIENLSIYGLDNLLVPIFIALALSKI